jgi:small subunit ribosomal protein S13
MKNYSNSNNNLKNTSFIYGVNTKVKNDFFKTFGINFRITPNNLKTRQNLKLNSFLTKINTGKNLKDSILNNIFFYIKIKNYKGNRHQLKYPTRGQRTHTNAKTRKKTTY